jgi:AbiU2
MSRKSPQTDTGVPLAGEIKNLSGRLSSADSAQRALEDLKLIGEEIRDLATDSHMFWQFHKEVVQRNGRLLRMQSPFIEMLSRWYVHATVARIRRLIDRRGGTASMARILVQLQNHPSLLVRSLGMEGMVLEISREQVQRDLSELGNACAPVKNYVDQYVAHHDKKPDFDLPKHCEVNAAIDKLIEIFKKYHSLLAGSDIDVKMDFLQDPFRVFKFAWLQEESSEH